MTTPIDPSPYVPSSALLPAAPRAATSPIASNARAAADSRGGDAIDILTSAARRLARAQRSLADSAAAGEALDRSATLLADLRASIARDRPSGASRTPPEIRSRIDEIVASIESVAAQFRPHDGHTVGFTPVDVSSYHVRSVSGSTTLPPGTAFDVEVEVLASATNPVMRLDFLSDNIDLGGPGPGGNDEQLVIEIEGSLGARTLSFASGTSVQDIAASIASFVSVTGVGAHATDGQTLTLASVEGADHFVSVRVLDNGEITQGEVSDRTGHDLGSLTSENAFITHGTNVQGRINGVDAESTGTGLRVLTDDYNLRIELGPGAWLSPQTFTAFHFIATGPEATPRPDEPLDDPLPRAAKEEARGIRRAPGEDAAVRIEGALERLRALVIERSDRGAIESTRAEALIRTFLSQRSAIDLQA